MDFTTDGGITAVVIGALTVFGMVLKKFGYLTLGKKNCSTQTGCPDADCSGKVLSTNISVVELRTDVGELREDIKGTHSRINKVDNRVSNLQGYLEGKLGK